ncbi:MAG: acyl carrier protein, partial [Pseudomonadota bacterium]
DSLMAVDLRNRLSQYSGVTLSSASIFEYPNLKSLSLHILEEMGLSENKVEKNKLDISPSENSDSSLDIDSQIQSELDALNELIEKN